MNVLRPRSILMVTMLALFANGCESTSAPSGEGTVTGVVTAADGVTPIALATVFIQSVGESNSTTSDVDGEYTLTDVPAGTQVIVAEKGAFRSTTTVNVAAGGTTTAPPAELQPVAKLGYVPGSYDEIEAIIEDLGYTADLVSHSTLSNSSALAQYGMLFLNCGANVSESAASALKAWVQAGGTLYASDWELDVIQAMFPNDILAVGSGDSQVITATVTNTALQQFTGHTTASIAYDLGAWKMLQTLSSVPTVLLRGTVTGYAEDGFSNETFANQALAISITHGAGRVVYTTFHNEAGVTAEQLDVLRYFIHF